MTDGTIEIIAGVALLILALFVAVASYIAYHRGYESGYIDAGTDRGAGLGRVSGVGGMCGKCGWEAPQVGTVDEIFRSIIAHECDDE